MYERVPRNRPPLLQHLEDPVVGFISSTSWGFGLSSPVSSYYRHIMGLFCLGLIYHHQTIELSRVLILSPHCYLKVTKLNSKCADGQNLVNIKMHQNH